MRKEVKPVEQAKIRPDQLEEYVKVGWRYVGAITPEQLIVERPLTPIDTDVEEENDKPKDIRKWFAD